MTVMQRIIKKSWLLAFPIAILIPLAAYSQTRPPLPFEDVGACPFECCVYREWITNKKTAIYKNRSNNSPVVFTLSPREKVQAVTGVVITTKAGEIRIKKTITIQAYSGDGTNKSRAIRANPGDIVYLLTSEGEGSYKAWFKGQEIIISAIDVMEANEPGSARYGSNIPRTTSTWWIQIKNRQGKTGWTTQAANFDNKDACGAPVDRSI